MFLIRLNINWQAYLFPNVIVAVRSIIVNIELSVVIVLYRIGDDLRCRVVFWNIPSGAVDHVAANIQTGYSAGVCITVHFVSLLYVVRYRLLYTFSGC